MKYELAKELKDAGFPNIGEGNGNRYIYPQESSLGLSRSQACYVPTLSELIEECGIGLSLVNYDGTFIATSCNNEKLSHEKGIGKTPEEAVARLWIELNK